MCDPRAARWATLPAILPSAMCVTKAAGRFRPMAGWRRESEVRFPEPPRSPDPRGRTHGRGRRLDLRRPLSGRPGDQGPPRLIQTVSIASRSFRPDSGPDWGGEGAYARLT